MYPFARRLLARATLAGVMTVARRGVASFLTWSMSALLRIFSSLLALIAPACMAFHSVGVMSMRVLPASTLLRASASAWNEIFFRSASSRCGLACRFWTTVALAMTWAFHSKGALSRAMLSLWSKESTESLCATLAAGLYSVSLVVSCDLRASVGKALKTVSMV